jgi:hypothetical protein
MQCWWCGVEPDDVMEVRTLSGPVRTIPQWPAGSDHVHAERAPTADGLADAGHDSLARIRAEGLSF